MAEVNTNKLGFYKDGNWYTIQPKSYNVSIYMPSYIVGGTATNNIWKMTQVSSPGLDGQFYLQSDQPIFEGSNYAIATHGSETIFEGTYQFADASSKTLLFDVDSSFQTTFDKLFPTTEIDDYMIIYDITTTPFIAVEIVFNYKK
jgi:hypothetical protein